MEDYETVILVKPEVFVYKIPPRATNRGYRAADWKLDTPDWTGRMRVVSKGKDCFIKLEDKNSGELFAKSPIDKYPGIAVESVMDSSRYFVLRIEDDNGRAAFIGIGFADRGDSFDLNVSLQEHFKYLQKSEDNEQGTDTAETKSNLDLGFKEGQTITINLGRKAGNSKPRPKTGGFSGTPGLLPPPPGGVKLPPPSAPKLVSPNAKLETSKNSSALHAPAVLGATKDLLLDLDSPIFDSSVPQPQPATVQPSGTELWGDFTTADPSPAQQSSGNIAEDWISF